MSNDVITESVETGESFSKKDVAIEAFILSRKEAVSRRNQQSCYNFPTSIFDEMKRIKVVKEIDLEITDRNDDPMVGYTLNDEFRFEISQNIRNLIEYKDEKVGLLLINGKGTKMNINRKRCNKIGKVPGTNLDVKWFVKLYDENPMPSKIIYTLDKNLKTLYMDIEIKYDVVNVEYMREPGDSYLTNKLGEDINLEKLHKDLVPYQRIFFGAPGTGKSYKLNEEAKDYFGYDTDNNLFYNNVTRVTFHSSYSYGLFVGVYKPLPTNNDDITYKYVPGPLIKLLLEALKNPDNPYLLIIEEINRADVSYVFGDIFQLLDRDPEGVSTYSIDINEDLKLYITEFLYQIHDEETKARIRATFSNDITKLKFPSNLYIWCTMNSADQGVNPLDTAFKRRWHFEPLDIDNGEELIKDYRMKLGKTEGEIFWNDLRKAINEELIKLDINEDKLLGSFFLSKNELEMAKDNYEKFNKLFQNKVLMYLFEDVAKHYRRVLFSVEKMTYAYLCEQYMEKGLKIFTNVEEMKSKIPFDHQEQ